MIRLRGTPRPKGSSLEQDMLTRASDQSYKVRLSGWTDWQDISWDDALNEIAHWTKKTRDATFVDKDANRKTEPTAARRSSHCGCTDNGVQMDLVVKAM